LLLRLHPWLLPRLLLDLFLLLWLELLFLLWLHPWLLLLLLYFLLRKLWQHSLLLGLHSFLLGPCI